MTTRFPLQQVTIEGIHYGVRVAGDGPALLLLHGFTGSSRTWQPHAAPLAGTRRVIAIDALGHGDSASPASPDRYGVDHAVRDVLAVLDKLEAGDVTLIGYSMGGRLALHVALAAPERVRALVLESASPGIIQTTEREARARDDEALAEAIEREGVDAFVARWEALPLFASQASLPAEARDGLRAQRRANSAVGLANSLRGMGAGTVPPVWERLGEIRMPVLLIAGALDSKYVTIARDMARRLPDALLDVVAHAGHAVHLEQPHDFDHTISRFPSSEARTGVPGHAHHKRSNLSKQ
jgi:2-succinyl-6-hydroxy-2,4-cyclohexadiene-1-carboxylate synthase